MWPFRRYPEATKDSIVNKLSSELSKDVVDSLRRNSLASLQLVSGNIKFMIIQVRDDDLNKLPKHIERALDIAQWPAPGSEDTELGVLMEPEVDHGEAEVYTRVQA